MDKIIPDEGLDLLGSFDDLDAALIGDEEFAKACSMIETGNAEENVIEDEDDDDFSEVDPDTDYSDDLSDLDDVENDAKALIAADRELMKDPFEEDETIDAAIGDDADEYIEDDEDEDEE